MVYGRYAGLRDSAWQVFLDFNITSLPVNVISIAKSAGIHVMKDSDTHLLSSQQWGLSILDSAQWYIIYDETLVLGAKRFTVAHELGHIFLGHSLKEGFHARQFEGLHPEDEQEANMFAIRLLAPACVLWGLDLHTAGEIAKVCNITPASAKWRAERMAVLYKRNKFFTSPLERRVYAQFEEFIREYKQREGV